MAGRISLSRRSRTFVPCNAFGSDRSRIRYSSLTSVRAGPCGTFRMRLSVSEPVSASHELVRRCHRAERITLTGTGESMTVTVSIKADSSVLLCLDQRQRQHRGSVLFHSTLNATGMYYSTPVAVRRGFAELVARTCAAR